MNSSRYQSLQSVNALAIALTLSLTTGGLASQGVFAADKMVTIPTPIPTHNSMHTPPPVAPVNQSTPSTEAPQQTPKADEVFNPGTHDHAQEAPLPLKTDPLPSGITPADVPAGPMGQLPISPSHVEGQYSLGLNRTGDDNPDPATSLLSGNASKSALMGVARGMTVTPLTRFKGPRMVYVELTIRNTSDQPIVLLGDGIRGQAAGQTIYPVGNAQLDKMDANVMTTKKKIEVAALGIGSLGLTSSIAYEWLAPQEYRRRNPGTATGHDRGRHEIEEGRFNRRVLLPADETTGWVAFYASDAQTLNSLTLPLLLPPYTTSSGSISVPVFGGAVAYQASQLGVVDGKPKTVYSIK